MPVQVLRGRELPWVTGGHSSSKLASCFGKQQEEKQLSSQPRAQVPALRGCEPSGAAPGVPIPPGAPRCRPRGVGDKQLGHIPDPKDEDGETEARRPQGTGSGDTPRKCVPTPPPPQEPSRSRQLYSHVASQPIPPSPPPGAETKGNVLWNWKNKKKKKRDCQRACQLLHPALRQLGQCSTPPDPPGCDTGGWWLRAARPALLPAHRETEAGGTEGRHWERWQQCPPSIPCAPPGQRGALSSALAPDAGGFISLPLYF